MIYCLITANHFLLHSIVQYKGLLAKCCVYVLQLMEVEEQISVESDRREATEQDDDDDDGYERVCSVYLCV